MSNVRTFRAASMKAAHDLVREELGADAVILHTKQVQQKRLLPWGKRRTEVEITAGTDVTVRQPAAAATSNTPSRGADFQSARPANTTATLLSPPPNRPTFGPNDAPSSGRTSAADILAAMEQQGSLDNLAAEFSRSNTTTPPPPPSRGADFQSARPAEPASPHLSSTPAPTSLVAVSHAPAVATPPPAVIPDEFNARLDRIQRMLETLGRTSRTRTDEVPAELFEVYTDLVEADVDDELARQLVQSLKTECTPDELRDATGVRDRLTRIVGDALHVGGPIRTGTGRRRVVALVGPTGVGKTTTIAKLAANFRLRDGIRMGLVTVDTYRIAAVDQLRTYAEIIDLPMKVVTTPDDMRTALDEFAGLDLVLIDTAGRSPRDDVRIRELEQLLAVANCDEVHLVLSLTTGLRGLETTADKFRPAGVTSMLLTKLDEAAGAGTIYSAAKSIDLPISYLTTGQDVPDDIEEARVDRMTRLVLGRERLT